MLQLLIVPVTPFQQNCSIAFCDATKQAAIIDPGGDLERIEAALNMHKLTPERVLITHGHLDHAGGAAASARKYEIPIEGPHKDDEFLLDSLDAQGEHFNMPAESFTPYRWLDNGDKVQIGEEWLSVRHCPGHTPGHIIFHHHKSHVAVVGDVLFAGSIGRTDLPRGNHEQLLQSIREQLWPLGDDVTFIPGHGSTSTFGQEKKTNPFVAEN